MLEFRLDEDTLLVVVDMVADVDVSVVVAVEVTDKFVVSLIKEDALLNASVPMDMDTTDKDIFLLPMVKATVDMDSMVEAMVSRTATEDTPMEVAVDTDVVLAVADVVCMLEAVELVVVDVDMDVRLLLSRMILVMLIAPTVLLAVDKFTSPMVLKLHPRRASILVTLPMRLRWPSPLIRRRCSMVRERMVVILKLDMLSMIWITDTRRSMEDTEITEEEPLVMK